MEGDVPVEAPAFLRLKEGGVMFPSVLRPEEERKDNQRDTSEHREDFGRTVKRRRRAGVGASRVDEGTLCNACRDFSLVLVLPDMAVDPSMPLVMAMMQAAWRKAK